MAVKPIPEGYNTVSPYLAVDRATEVLQFVKKVFDAQERYRLDMPDGRIGHAEVRIGDSVVMLADISTSDRDTPMPAMLYVYVEDVDKIYRRALEAGATSLEEPADQFYGDRRAAVRDASGNQWWIATHVEDVPPEEMGRRAAARQKS